jgi:hypothetical protein
MLNQILNVVEPIIVSAAVACLTALVGLIGNAAVKFISTKKVALEHQIGVDKYNADLQKAREVWGIGDEFFRTHPEMTKTIETAAAKFQDELLKVIPALTTDEIDHLRQAVAGEVNKGRAAVTAPATQEAAATAAQ